MDDRDKQIIRILLKYPKISQQAIAKKLKLSQPSIWARIKKLEEKKIIKYRVLVEPFALMEVFGDEPGRDRRARKTREPRDRKDRPMGKTEVYIAKA